MPVDTFLQEHWAQAPVYVEGQRDKFASLFDWQRFDHYLNHHLRFFRPPQIQLYDGRQGGGVVPFEAYSETIIDANRCEMTVTSPTKVRGLCDEGATLSIHSVHDGDPALKSLAEGLGFELGERLRIDLFFTPPGAFGVHQHYDREDVLVVQLEGQKEWHLHAPTVESPMAMPDYDELENAPRIPDRVFRTSAGDLMHLPRGTWHIAQTTEQASLHLSIRVACRTGGELLQWAVAALVEEDASVRRNLPLQRQSSAPFGYDTAALGDRVAALRSRLDEFLSSDDFVQRYNAACIATDRSERPYQLAAPVIDSEVRVRRVDHQRWHLASGADGVRVTIAGATIRVSDPMKASLHAILDRRTFTCADIEGPPEQVRALVRKLLDAGALRVEGADG